MKIKICGITNLRDALLSYELGATAIGLIFASSPRRVSIETAREVVRNLPRDLESVAVFQDQDADFVRRVLRDVRARTLQFHGNESPEFVASFGYPTIKSFRVGEAGPPPEAERYPDRILLEIAPEHPPDLARVRRDFFIAGSLTPDNVREVASRVRPYGVDVARGVEASPGLKDPAKLKAFIKEARRCG
ncbi:MAG: phosphoribosylanthranilate isomerase [Planctomycetes bacterium]|nr:phosphoribosylanthranilate isomerase [Planctomycetota bacterium]